MSDGELATVPNNRALVHLVLLVIALATAGTAVILLAGSLGAATSGRSIWSQWFGPGVALTHSGATAESKRMRGQIADKLTRTSDFLEDLSKSGV
jgi:hypothetical protein